MNKTALLVVATVFMNLNFTLSVPLDAKAEPGKIIVGGDPVICTDISNGKCFSCDGKVIAVGNRQPLTGDFKCPPPIIPLVPSPSPVIKKEEILEPPEAGVVPRDKDTAK